MQLIHYTGTEAEFNSLFNAIDSHIANDTIHHTTTELDELYEPKKGTDDNYVTDEEKIKLSNLSGVNTGDQDLTAINSHLGDATKHIDSTAELGTDINETNHSLLIWNGLKALKVTFARVKTWIGSYFLKLDQSTPQTLTQSPKIDSLTVGQLVYVSADKQLIPVNSVIWDDIKKQLQINDYAIFNDIYKLALSGNIAISGEYVGVAGAITFDLIS